MSDVISDVSSHIAIFASLVVNPLSYKSDTWSSVLRRWHFMHALSLFFDDGTTNCLIIDKLLLSVPWLYVLYLIIIKLIPGLFFSRVALLLHECLLFCVFKYYKNDIYESLNNWLKIAFMCDSISIFQWHLFNHEDLV
jgi:hypothetical protein